MRTAVGNGQQRIFVMPGLDMVVTILAGRYNDFTTGGSLATRAHVLPAVRTGIKPGCPGGKEPRSSLDPGHYLSFLLPPRRPLRG